MINEKSLDGNQTFIVKICNFHNRLLRIDWVLFYCPTMFFFTVYFKVDTKLGKVISIIACVGLCFLNPEPLRVFFSVIKYNRKRFLNQHKIFSEKKTINWRNVEKSIYIV